MCVCVCVCGGGGGGGGKQEASQISWLSLYGFSNCIQAVELTICSSYILCCINAPLYPITQAHPTDILGGGGGGGGGLDLPLIMKPVVHSVRYID